MHAGDLLPCNLKQDKREYFSDLENGSVDVDEDYGGEGEVKEVGLPHVSINLRIFLWSVIISIILDSC